MNIKNSVLFFLHMVYLHHIVCACHRFMCNKDWNWQWR